MPKVLRALQRGAACKVDFCDHFDFWAYTDKPLNELRKSWNVVPLEA